MSSPQILCRTPGLANLSGRCRRYAAILGAGFALSIGVTTGRAAEFQALPTVILAEHSAAFWWSWGSFTAGIVALIWAGTLVRSNRELERRVAERTDALNEENAVRRRAEAALQESQALYHSLVETLPVAVYRKDSAGRYVFANARFAEFNDVKLDQVAGKTVHELLPLELATAYAREDEAVVETGMPLELDKEHRSRDGRIRHLHILKTPVFDPNGKVIGTQGMLTDVTARRLAEIELASERDLLRSLLHSSSDHIYFKDLDSRFLKCSKRLAESFGLKHMDEVVGKTDFNFFQEAHARAAFDDEQNIIRTGRPIVGKVEKESWRGDGKTTWALTSKLPLQNKAGAIIGTFGISKDITDIKEAEAKLEAVHRQLLETSRKAGMAEVATSVLHNVGNVLNSVTTSAGVLVDHLRASKISGVERVANLLAEHQADLAGFLAQDKRGSQVPGYLKTLAGHLAEEQKLLLTELRELCKNIDHIKEIVAMQQSYARVAGVVERLSMADLVEDALRMHNAGLARHHVRVVRNLDPSVEIQVDKHKVIQILINLITNAKHALGDATVEDKVLTVSAHHAGTLARVSVQDNGVGVLPENLTRIFSHGFTTRSEGHGFGLHAGALAAREMGGSLTVHSDGPGHGATFTLELPLQPPGPVGDGTATELISRVTVENSAARSDQEVTA